MDPDFTDDRKAFSAASLEMPGHDSLVPAHFPPQQYARLLTGLVHKLNNVITVLSGHTGLLLLQPKLSRSVRDPVEQMSQATQLVSRYLDEAVIVTRTPKLQVETVDVVPLLAALADDPEPPATTVKLSEQALVRGDRGQLRAAFQEVVRNAREAQAQTVTCELRPADAGWQVAFRDDGVGINGEVMRRVFEPFFTTKKAPENLGLGLFKIQGYLALTTGRLELLSDGATYTEACFTLPAA